MLAVCRRLAGRGASFFPPSSASSSASCRTTARDGQSSHSGGERSRFGRLQYVSASIRETGTYVLDSLWSFYSEGLVREAGDESTPSRFLIRRRQTPTDHRRRQANSPNQTDLKPEKKSHFLNILSVHPRTSALSTKYRIRPNKTTKL